MPRPFFFLFFPALTLLLSADPLCAQEKIVAESGAYTLADLKILYEEKNYQEFFAHAQDPRPSLRGPEWKEMVLSLALSYQKEVIKTGLAAKENLLFLEQLSKMPLIRGDEFFRKNRIEVGKLYFKNCTLESCAKEALAFWREDPEQAELGLSLGTLAREKKWGVDPWVFFKQATLGPMSEFYCKEKELQQTLLERLALLVGKNLKEEMLSKEVRELVSADCWISLDKVIRPQLSSDQKSERDFAYHILKAHNALSSEERDFYALAYYLDGPAPGEVFNESWRLLQDLAKNNKRREKALRQIFALDPLPDEIFALKDENKRQEVLLENLFKTVPEYMDRYARTCLKYLQGQGSFENGNPTMHCFDLIELTRDSDRSWIDPGLLTQLQKKIVKK